MTKFILCLAIVFFTSLCGWILAKRYKKRRDFLMQLSEFNDRFLSEVDYYKRPLKEFILEYPYKNEFGDFLLDFTGGLGEKTLSLDELEFLTIENKRLIHSCFSMLGKGDTASQKKYFNGMKELLKKAYGEAETTYKKYGNLYVKLGFLCGLLIVILII